MLRTSLLLLATLSLAACSSTDDAAPAGPKTDAQYEADVTSGMHSALLGDIKALHQSAIDMQTTAPDHAWDADADADAIARLTAAWLRARKAYERTEGALAPLFPDIDGYIDGRYEDFLERLGPDGDQDPFDDQGVTGMHAIERIVFAPTTPATVVALEATLPGYRAAAWPATDDEASEFKTLLCQRLITDTETLVEYWAPSAIDLEGSFRGLIALMNEQREKVSKAASEEEESRYAQRTMADIRDNLAGTRAVYSLFRPWLGSKQGGDAIDDDVQAAFSALDLAYEAVSGDAIPTPPDDWNSEEPTEANLATPFGELYGAVHAAVDPNVPGSAVDGMNRAAVELGFVEFVQ
jgi:iron uptake system component EfeO